MNKHAIFHLPDSAYAFALSENRLCLRLRAARGDIRECLIFYGDRANHRAKMAAVTMKLVASDRLFDYFEADFTVDISRICYYFWLSDGNEDVYYYSGEFTLSPADDRNRYFQFPYIRREDIVSVPEWAKKTIIYQVFPDSFATGKRYISGKGSVRTAPCGAPCESRLGGALRGIIENLDYINDLGVNCIYLNPIFTAGSYHKYDTIDYFSIDPCFGTMEDFRELVASCHKMGIRVILDGVFNHCGWNFFAFRDVCEKGKASAYKDWFYRLEFPVDTENLNYAAFAYVRQMPKLNTGNPEVVEYLCNVGRFWIREAGIDGWRLDVANEVNHDFWRAFRRAVKAENPETFLIAEVWEDAEQWLYGDQFDSAMNYRFAEVCRAFFPKNGISVDEFDNRLGYMRMRYKSPVTKVQMNLLDSHDVPRFLHFCDGDIRRLKLAALFQMCWEGIPSILAGDEKGITGSTEEEYRQAMVWEDSPQSAELTAFYKKIITIRKDYIDEFAGGVKTVLKDNGKGIYAFSRYSNEREIIVVLNNNDNKQPVSIPCRTGNQEVTDLLNGTILSSKDGIIKLTLGPVSGAVLAGM